MNCTASIPKSENHIVEMNHAEKIFNSKFITREDSVTFKNSIVEDLQTDKMVHYNSDDESVISNQSSSIIFTRMSQTDSSDNEFSDSSRVPSQGVGCDKESLTLAWVKEMSYETFDIDCTNINEVFHTDDNLVSNSQSTLISPNSESNSPQSSCWNDSNMDENFFVNESSDEQSTNFDIDFSNALTEDNLDGSFSFFTKGSLKSLDDDEFSDDDDLEIMFTQCTLSPDTFSEWDDIVTEGSTLSQGFSNEVFTEDFCQSLKSPALKRVNDTWNDSMEKIEQSPRTPIKVSFSPKLVTIYNYEKEVEGTISQDSIVLDKLRFQKRIKELESILSPFLSLQHREKILLKNA